MIADLHTHILPGIDDGAATLTESIRVLQLEVEDWIDTVAFTPHFRLGIQGMSEFLKKRDEAFKRLSYVAEKNELPVSLILGAEVIFSTQLAEIELSKLCYTGTRTILVEMPVNHYPIYTREVFHELLLKGYTPLIAHVERCPYLIRDIELLEELVSGGVKTQVNAGSLLTSGKMRNHIFSLIKGGMIHIIATDTHGLNNRPPQLGKALKIVKKHTGVDMAGAAGTIL